MKNSIWLKTAVWWFITGVITVLIIQSYFKMPVVHWSMSQDRCVRVIYDGLVEDGCHRLPDRYIRVWVK